ncbi:hypothetical protein [Bacillus solitudinis]|uniref:hypothetical protein n=1 Tax=Bacillus solitudinis TaxID=2014074 RepID=UPI000C230577|nr:hypothetical protein [Bacillus solitudinis]
MKTQPLKQSNRAELALIIDAMRRYLFLVKRSSQRIILSDYVKIMKAGTEAELDGMGMKHISSALKAKAMDLQMRYGFNSTKQERKMMYNLAFNIEMKRIKFQQSFYLLHIKKEEPTALTVSPSKVYSR